MDNRMAAGWIHTVQDSLTTISRRLREAEGYQPYDNIHQARMELKDASESLTRLNVRMLVESD